MKDVLGVGVLGCGDIAQTMYLQGINALEDEGVCRLVAICDTDASRLSQAAARFAGARAYADCDGMLADPNVHVVVNLTPNQAHAACSLKAIASGRHLYTEKPIATTMDDADRVIDSAAEQGITLVCAPVILLHPEVRQAVEWVKNGSLGKVALARARASHGGPARLYDFTTDPTWFYKEGGGPLFDLAVYPISVLCAMLGPVRHVSAFAGISSPELTVRSGIAKGKTIHVEVPDNVPMMLDFGNATFAIIDAAFTVLSAKGPRMEIYGDKGTLNLYSRPEDPPYERYVDDPEKGVRGWLQHELSYRGSAIPYFGAPTHTSWSFAQGVRHLIECVVGNAKPIPSGELARHVLEIILAAMESARSGRAVELRTRFDLAW